MTHLTMITEDDLNSMNPPRILSLKEMFYLPNNSLFFCVDEKYTYRAILIKINSLVDFHKDQGSPFKSKYSTNVTNFLSAIDKPKLSTRLEDMYYDKENPHFYVLSSEDKQNLVKSLVLNEF